MRIISKILALVMINGYIVYFVAKFLPSLLVVKPSLEAFTPEILLIVGGIFWLVNDVAKAIVRLFSLPLIWLSLGLVSIVINVLALYGFVYVVNSLDLGVQFQIPSVLSAVLLSIVISFANLIFKKL